MRYVVPGDPEWPTQVDDLMRVRAARPPRRSTARALGEGPDAARPARPRRSPSSGRGSATTYGTEVAAGIAATLVRAGHPVVSGAAFGIDQAAHRGALGVDGANVAVLACGADRAYPTAHRDLLDHLGRTSAVIAEVPPGCAPTRGRFLSRNRLIAALTRGTVVVEAAVRSGALNTASWATRLNRHVMGVPGPVTSAQSQGRPPADPERRGDAGDPGRARCSRSSATSAPTWPRRRARRRAPATGCGRATRGSSTRCRSPARLPVDSIATTAGLALLEVQSGLSRLTAARPRRALAHGLAADPRGAGVSRPPGAGEPSRAGRRARPRVTRMASPTRDLPAVLVDYERHLVSERDLAPHTVRAYLSDVAGLLEHADRLGHTDLAELDLRTLRSWLAHQQVTGRSRTTLARRATAVRVFTAWLARTGRIPDRRRRQPALAEGPPDPAPGAPPGRGARAGRRRPRDLADDGSPLGLRDVGDARAALRDRGPGR